MNVYITLTILVCIQPILQFKSVAIKVKHPIYGSFNGTEFDYHIRSDVIVKIRRHSINSLVVIRNHNKESESR